MIYSRGVTIQDFFARAKARKAKRAAKRAELGLPPRVKRASRKSLRQILVARLDEVFSLFIRLRDKRGIGACRICHRRPIEVCYHFIPRGAFAVRWDPENACGACSPCNGGEKWHRLEYRQKHIDILGPLKYAEMEQKARQTAKFSTDDLQRMIREFRERMARPL